MLACFHRIESLQNLAECTAARGQAGQQGGPIRRLSCGHKFIEVAGVRLSFYNLELAGVGCGRPKQTQAPFLAQNLVF